MSEPAAHATTQRALGKQLLLMRAATERAEMVRAIGAARESATFFKSGVPGLVLAQGLPLALGLLKRAPWAGSVLSLALPGARRPLLRYALLGAGSALLAWKGYQWFAGRSEQPSEQPADADVPLV
ncbi:MAG: hypothetical protein Q7T46_08240 [Polaromonas sp.]|nr:hypothetical protein [Polaromonas sp.]